MCNRYKNETYTGKNRYVYFRIPLIVKYDLLENEKWSLNVGTGLIVGILSKVSGKTLSEQNEIQPIEDFPPLRTNLFWYAGMQLSRKLNENIHVFLGFSGEYMLKPLFPQEKNIQRKMLYYSMKLGVDYFF